MALVPGARIGVYEVTALIGEGGMGQVYRATDTMLGRQVAIKISMSVAGGAAKTIGSLGNEYLPATQQSPGLRLSLTPDGKSITFSTRKSTSNLWLIEGLNGVTPP